jgi:hypothetical protein
MSEYDIKDLDDSWISEFENIDKEYKHFYKENITFIKVHCIYINQYNEVEKIKQEKIFLKIPNYLSREEIISIIKHNNMDTNIKYSLLSILKYNMTLEPYHLYHFLKTNNKKDNHEENIEYSYLTSLKNIDAITFLPCIYMFQDLNDLFILFHQKPIQELKNSIKNGTKRIYIKNHVKNKTIRNSFKDI